eukprot:scaffold2639_cov361-Pavlova_lutheri.AAC.2
MPAFGYLTSKGCRQFILATDNHVALAPWEEWCIIYCGQKSKKKTKHCRPHWNFKQQSIQRKSMLIRTALFIVKSTSHMLQPHKEMLCWPAALPQQDWKGRKQTWTHCVQPKASKCHEIGRCTLGALIAAYSNKLLPLFVELLLTLPRELNLKIQ